MKALANVVDLHTVTALTEWKCNAASCVKNFYIVYGGAVFGDDVISSDYITDYAYCFEGGVQVSVPSRNS